MSRPIPAPLQSVRPLARPISLAGAAFVLLSAASFSWQGLFTKLAFTAGASVTTIGLGRFALAAALLWGYALARHLRGDFPLRLAARSTLTLLALGAVGYFLGSLTYFEALRFIPVSLSGLLLYTYPAITALLAVWLGRERLTRALGAGLLVTLTGLAVTLGAPAMVSAPRSDWRGVGLVLASAALYASYIVGSERSLHRIHSVLAIAYIATGAMVSYLVATLVTGSFTAAIGVQGWGWIAAIALVSTVIAAGTFLAGLRRLGPARAATLSTVEPLFTVIFAAIVLGERLRTSQLIGGLVILAGVILVIRERTAPGERREDPAAGSSLPAR